MTTVDLKIIKDEVIRIAQENPDYVYEYSGVSRLYTYCDSEPDNSYNGCLIGRALISKHPKLKELLREIDNSNCCEASISDLDRSKKNSIH